MTNYCTYFDHNYLSRGLVLYDTLMQHCPGATLYVLALSDVCVRVLNEMALPNMQVTTLAELETYDHELFSCKSSRNIVEYYFTISPCFPLYLLKTKPEIDILTYVDADCAFFSSPEPVLAEFGDGSIGLVEHRFTEFTQEAIFNGRFNVGWLTYRNDDTAIEFLNWWRDRCLEWCHDYHEDGKYADQKYLDQVPLLFKSVNVLQHRGVNVAPWNLTDDIKYSGSNILVEGQPLVIFHFHRCRHLWWRFWNTGLEACGVIGSVVLKRFYGDYIQRLIVRDENISHYMCFKYSEKRFGRHFLSMLSFKFIRRLNDCIRRNTIVYIK